MRKLFFAYQAFLLSLCMVGFSGPASAHEEGREFSGSQMEAGYSEDLSYYSPDYIQALACKAASSAQLSLVDLGSQKKEEFLDACARSTNNSPWCQQLVRPNPSSIGTFRCTYGSRRPHALIHPSESTWKNAFTGVQLVDDLARLGIKVCQIYNWWRPEPYNKNVGGAAGRHPYGTSIDVRFCSSKDAVRGFDELCKYRKRGVVRALGYYGNSGVHIGVGDRTANTWGRGCS